MSIYGNLFLCFILFELPIYSPLTGSIHHAPHSYHIPINAKQSHDFTAPIILYYCQNTHPPDQMIHLDPCSWWPPACAMGITASMPTEYHYNHLWLLTPIPIPTHSTPTSRITNLLGLLDWTLDHILLHIGDYLPSNTQHYRRHESSRNGVVQVIPQSL